MYNHAPHDYVCPLCLLIEGIENEHTMAKQADIVYRNEHALAMVNSKFIKGNPGHVIVMPTHHFEHLYDLPQEYMSAIMEVSQKIAIALKATRNCDGIWIGQNNEPASGQHAFHYHMHVVPRFEGDSFKDGESYVAAPEDRIPYAEGLRSYFKDLESHS